MLSFTLGISGSLSLEYSIKDQFRKGDTLLVWRPDRL